MPPNAEFRRHCKFRALAKPGLAGEFRHVEDSACQVRPQIRPYRDSKAGSLASQITLCRCPCLEIAVAARSLAFCSAGTAQAPVLTLSQGNVLAGCSGTPCAATLRRAHLYSPLNCLAILLSCFQRSGGIQSGLACILRSCLKES